MSSVNNENRNPIYQGEELMGYSLSNTRTMQVKRQTFKPQNQDGKGHFLPFLAFVLCTVVQGIRNRKTHKAQDNNALSKNVEIPPTEYAHFQNEGNRVAVYHAGKLVGYVSADAGIQTPQSDQTNDPHSTPIYKETKHASNRWKKSSYIPRQRINGVCCARYC